MNLPPRPLAQQPINQQVINQQVINQQVINQQVINQGPLPLPSVIRAKPGTAKSGTDVKGDQRPGCKSLPRVPETVSDLKSLPVSTNAWNGEFNNGAPNLGEIEALARRYRRFGGDEQSYFISTCLLMIADAARKDLIVDLAGVLLLEMNEQFLLHLTERQIAAGIRSPICSCETLDPLGVRGLPQLMRDPECPEHS